MFWNYWRISCDVFVLMFMCDGRIFWREKWKSLVVKLTKSITETDRWTLKKKSFRLLFYCTILKILIIFNYVSIKFSSKCSEEKLSVSYHPFLFCLQKLLKSELRVRELKICKRWNWSVPGDYHQQIVKNDCFESWRRIHMPKMG